MHFLWLALLLANFSRSTNEKAAYLFRNAVLNPKNENLEGSIDVNGLPSSSVPPLPSELHQRPLTQDLPNGGFHSVESSGMQPQLLDTEELQAGLQWKSQNDRGQRELNSFLTWWWIRWKQQLVDQQHRRWRQQPPSVNQQQYYRWQHQQPLRNSVVQNLENERRQNPIDPERILNKSQLNHDKDLKNVIPQDKFIFWDRVTTRTPNGLLHRDDLLEENEQLNSALVEGQKIQKLENSFAEKSQNQTGNQLDIRNENLEKLNKVIHQSNRSNPASPPRVPDSREQILEKEEQKGLGSSRLPSTKLQLPGSMSRISPKSQTDQQQSTTSTFSSSEADEESYSSSESSWRNKELYPIWKPPLPGLEIFPVVDTHTVRSGNLLPKRQDNVKPLVQADSHSRSDKQSRTLRDLYVQRETWVFGVNLSYKIRKNKNILFPEQPKSISQPTSPYQQTNSILQEEEEQPDKLSATNNELLDRMKPNWGSEVTVTKVSDLPRSLDIPTTQEAKMDEKLNGDRNDQKHESKIDQEYLRRNQTKDDVPLKVAAIVGQDTKSHLSPQKNSLQMPYQRKIKVHYSLSEKSLHSGSLGIPQPLSLLHLSEDENMQAVQSKKIKIIPPASLTAASKPPMTVELEFYTTEISTQINEKPVYNSESNTDPRSQKLKKFGLNVGTEPSFTSKTHLNSEGHPVEVKSDTPESGTSNKVFGEVDKSHSGIFTGQSTFGLDNLNASTDPFHRVLKIPQIEEQNTNPDNSYSNPQPAQKELSLSYVDSNHVTSSSTTGSRFKKHQLFGSSEANFAHLSKKRTLDSRGNSPKETDNQRLSNMESLGGPINIDPYDASLQNIDPSKSSVDMELSSNELEYLFQAISSGMKLLVNKIMGNSR